MENTQLQKNETAISFLSANDLQIYKEVDKQVAELLNSGLTGIALTFAKVTVVKKIEDVLTPAFMADVISLKGKEYGFKTDERNGEKYPETTVKQCIVQAMLYGAEITGNEFNILGGNCYLTKSYCKNWLRKQKIWYKHILAPSKKSENGGWIIPTTIEWIDFEKQLHKETIEIPVNKFEKTSEATLRGQAERDAMAYIIEEVRKESLPMNKNDDFVETPYTEIKEKSNVHNANISTDSNSKSKSINDKSNEVGRNNTTNENTQELPSIVDEKIQKEFDDFINNKRKVTNIQTLTDRAKAFCADYEITVKQLNLTIFNDIKFKIDNNQW